MKKPYKVLSSGALIAALTASSITPVAVSAAEDVENYTLQEVVFVDGDKLAKIPFSEYTIALALNGINDDVKHVVYPNGNVYPLAQYSIEYAFSNKNPEKTYKALAGKEVKSEVYEGYIDEDGKVRAKVDEQPEDRLNETFFYNVA